MILVQSIIFSNRISYHPDKIQQWSSSLTGAGASSGPYRKAARSNAVLTPDASIDVDSPLMIGLGSWTGKDSQQQESARTATGTSYGTEHADKHSHTASAHYASAAHSTVDDDGICACRCGKIFRGSPKNAHANRKRHIQAHSNDALRFVCPYRDLGCTYTANRKDNVVAHCQKSCRYRPSRITPKETHSSLTGTARSSQAETNDLS